MHWAYRSTGDLCGSRLDNGHKKSAILRFLTCGTSACFAPPWLPKPGLPALMVRQGFQLCGGEGASYSFPQMQDRLVDDPIAVLGQF